MENSEMIKLGLRPSADLRFKVLFRQEGKCKNCGIPQWQKRRAFDLHRIIPGFEGGLYRIDNVIALCQKCHYKETQKENERRTE